MIIVSGIVVFGLVGFMFFSPLSSQFTEEGSVRGESWKTEILVKTEQTVTAKTAMLLQI